MKAKNKLFAICIALLTITLVHDTVNAQKTAPGPGYFSRVFLTDDDLGDPFDGRAIDLYYNPTTYNFEIKGLNGLNSYGPHLTMNLTSGNIGIAQDPDNNCKFRINATTSNDWGLIVDHSSKTGFKHAIRANVDHKNTKGLSVGYVEGSKSTVENFYVYGSGNLNTQGTIIAKGDISSDQNIIGNGLYGKFFVIEDNFRGTFDGEYFSTTGTLRLNTNCNSNVFITGDTGRVGIGASNVDRAKLFVKSPSFYQTGIVLDHYSDSASWRHAFRINVDNDETKAFSIKQYNDSEPNFIIWGNGVVNAKKIVAQAFQVTPDAFTINWWPDYVFTDSYNLPSLSEIEKFIQTEKHLPEVPNAQTIEENGYDLIEMNKILLQKIEELTLYTIQQQKEIDQLKEEINK